MNEKLNNGFKLVIHSCGSDISMILLKQLFHNPDVIFNVLDHKIQF